MGLRFYIASSLDNAAAVQQLAKALKDGGHEQTYDWTTHGSVYRPDASREANAEAFCDAALKELEGVKTADAVIFLFPGRRGTHIEVGAALALEKPVLLVRPLAEHEQDERCPAFYRLCHHIDAAPGESWPVLLALDVLDDGELPEVEHG